jgi:hypothetical protein
MVAKAIKRLQIGCSQNHDGLIAKHISHACDTLAPLLAHMFNRALCEGFPPTWSTNTISPIHKSGDPLDPNNYQTIMIGHTMAKLYGSVLEAELSAFAEYQGHKAPRQAGFRRTFSTLDHIFTLRAIIEESKARGRRVFCCFVDFRKAFDTVPRARLLHRLQSLAVPDEMIWSIITLYKSVIGRVRAQEGCRRRLLAPSG